MVCRDGGALVTPTIEDSTQSCDKEGDAEPLRPFQIQSYADLLKFPVIPASSKDAPSGKRDIDVPVVDAIIVPTIRSAEQLGSAVELASRARCQLIALYTDSLPPELSSVLDRLKPGQATPLVLRSNVGHRLLDIGATIPQTKVSFAALDISRKRNLGLMVGRKCGWTRMLFLDDDIRKLNVAKLSPAAAMLDEYPVVGLQVNKYPDASVVGHARRLTGRRQEPFISGGSLLVNPQLITGFFPPVYHEDWLCVINHIRLGEVAVGGQVGQLPYAPFTTAGRAQFEEFGDTLAAGLLWLILQSATGGQEPIMDARNYWHTALDEQFWTGILRERAELLDNLTKDVKLMRGPHAGTRPLQSVLAAKTRSCDLSPGEFVSFMRNWLDLVDTWQTRLDNIRSADSVAEALTNLGLKHVVHTGKPDRRHALTTAARRRLAKVRPRRETLAQNDHAGISRHGLPGQGLRRLGGIASLSAGHDRRLRFGRLIAGRGARGGDQRPPARADQAEHEDGSAAGGQKEPVGVTGWHEPAPEWAVKVRGKDRAGHGHAK
jgi:hypothetical protein